MKTFAVIMNPKTLELVAVSADDPNPNEVTVDISIFGQRGAEGFIGRGYYHPHDTRRDEDNLKYPRVHAPQGVKPRGHGHGFCLYSGAALAAARDDRYEGVHSIEGNRSDSASRLWDSFVVKGYAHRENTGDTSENCDTIDDYEHCADIDENDRFIDDADNEGHSGYITDRQVCGTVSVEVCKDEEADYLSHEAVLKTGLVLIYQHESDEGIDEETTETVNADLIVRAKVANVEAATRLYDHLRKQYDDELLQAFISRQDIQELLFSQQRLPGVAGFGRASIPRPTRFVPLPPLTDESAALLERWKDLED